MPELINIGADLFVPQEFNEDNITIHEEPNIIYSVRIVHSTTDNEFHITSLTVATRDGNPLPAENRILYATIKKKAISKNIYILDRQKGLIPYYPVNIPRSHKRGATTVDLLYTSRIYVASKVGGGDAHEAVANRLGISKATAGRWVSKARELGYIDGHTTSARQ